MNRGLLYALATVALVAYAQFANAGAGVIGPPIPPPATVPEPDTISLFALGAGVIALVTRWRRRK